MSIKDGIWDCQCPGTNGRHPRLSLPRHPPTTLQRSRLVSRSSSSSSHITPFHPTPSFSSHIPPPRPPTPTSSFSPPSFHCNRTVSALAGHDLLQWGSFPSNQTVAAVERSSHTLQRSCHKRMQLSRSFTRGKE